MFIDTEPLRLVVRHSVPPVTTRNHFYKYLNALADFYHLIEVSHTDFCATPLIYGGAKHARTDVLIILRFLHFRNCLPDCCLGLVQALVPHTRPPPETSLIQGCVQIPRRGLRHLPPARSCFCAVGTLSICMALCTVFKRFDRQRIHLLVPPGVHRCRCAARLWSMVIRLSIFTHGLYYSQLHISTPAAAKLAHVSWCGTFPPTRSTGARQRQAMYWLKRFGASRTWVIFDPRAGGFGFYSPRPPIRIQLRPYPWRFRPSARFRPRRARFGCKPARD